MANTDSNGCYGCVILIAFLIVSYLIISAIGLEGYVALIVILFILICIASTSHDTPKSRYRKRASYSPKSRKTGDVNYGYEKNLTSAGLPYDLDSFDNLINEAEPEKREKYIIDEAAESRKRYIEALNKLMEILSDADEPSDRMEAARYIGETGDSAAVKALADAKRDPDFNVRRSAAKALKKIKETQKDLIKNYEGLICENDFFRPSKFYLSESVFVACRVCGHSKFLQSSIEEVIGFIGGQEYSWRDGNRLFINLWDEETKKARNADIDALWIMESEDIDYGWAISAVVQNLRNDITIPRKLEEIPAVIKGNPPITVEEAETLEEVFAEIKFES